MTTRKLVDMTTGEIYDMSEYSLRSHAQDEYFKQMQYRTRDKRHFSFADMENIREVIANVSTVRCGYLLILQCYMEYGTRKLTLTRKEMPQAVGVSEKTFGRFWNELQVNGIVTEQSGEFYVNERYHFRSQARNERVVKLFTTTIKQLKDQLRPAELGFLYKLLPNVHYETNMLCADPFVAPEGITFLNTKQIALLVELDEKKTTKLLGKLRKLGIVAETSIGDNRCRFYTLNPFIFYRRKGQPDDTLRGMFATTPFAVKNKQFFTH